MFNDCNLIGSVLSSRSLALHVVVCCIFCLCVLVCLCVVCTFLRYSLLLSSKMTETVSDNYNDYNRDEIHDHHSLQCCYIQWLEVRFKQNKFYHGRKAVSIEQSIISTKQVFEYFCFFKQQSSRCK